jgi:hypothetical protein
MVVNIVDVGWATSKSGCLPISGLIPSLVLAIEGFVWFRNLVCCGQLQVRDPQDANGLPPLPVFALPLCFWHPDVISLACWLGAITSGLQVCP